MSKSDLVRSYIASGEWKKALKEAKDFRIGITKEQRSVLARAYECMVHPDFYRQIGKDVNACIEYGKITLVSVMM